MRLVGTLTVGAFVLAAAVGTPVEIASASALPDDPGYPLQWWSSNTGQVVDGSAGTAGADVNAEAAWARSTGGPGPVVAVLDTGVDYTHPDLAGNMWSNPGGVGDCPAGTHGFNVLSSTAPCDPRDDDDTTPGHGTRIAGLVAGAGGNGVGVAGVSWRTPIMAVKWTDHQAWGSNSRLIAAIDKVIAARQAGVDVRVINVSGTFVRTAYSEAVRQEIVKAGDNGILFVTAAGNTRQNNDTTPRYPCDYAAANELCVAATDQDDRLAGFSNFGPGTVDMAAPGVNLYSTLRGGGYGYGDGTSYAAPLVTGAAALALSAQELSVSELRQRLLAAVDPLPGLAGLVRTAGRLDVCKALPGCVPQTITGIAVTAADTSATISGQVDPRGQSTAYHVEYATGGSPTARTPDQDAGAGVQYTPITTTITGLTPGTSYHVRLVTTSPAGTGTSSEMTFTTTGTPPAPPVAVGSVPSTTRPDRSPPHVSVKLARRGSLARALKRGIRATVRADEAGRVRLVRPSRGSLRAGSTCPGACAALPAVARGCAGRAPCACVRGSVTRRSAA